MLWFLLKQNLQSNNMKFMQKSEKLQFFEILLEAGCKVATAQEVKSFITYL